MKKLEIYKHEIEKIKSKKPLTAENVLEEARNKKNPLHDYFEWDNSEAGEKWRLHQARLLINVVMIESANPDEGKLFAYEIIKDMDSKEYKNINEILSNNEWRVQVMNQAIHFLKYWKVKYERYKFTEFNGIMKEIESLGLKIKQNDRKSKTKRIIAATAN